MIKRIPLKFYPYLKTVIWGGNKICKYKGIEQNEPNVGESWEISAVPGHESVVSEGVYKGRSIKDLIDKFGKEFLGEKVYKKYGADFPLLVKIIDAADNLSVQVHPDDALAKQRHGSLGKTEMWYIISSDENAKIYAGLKEQLTPEEYVKRVEDKTFSNALAVHDSKAGDVFFLPAGRVHAIGAGNLLAEIQESSDVTYRIYDYDRKDAQGNPRELHTELAKDAIDYTVYETYKNDSVGEHIVEAEIVSCDHFKVERLLVDGEKKWETNPDSFTIIMCLEGEAEVSGDDGATKMKQGETVLFPAATSEILISGKATLLRVTV